MKRAVVRVGRPAGEVRRALLVACEALATAARGATLREIAARANVGLATASVTVRNMRRAGELCIAGVRRVSYRSRPVAEYKPVARGSTPVLRSMGLGRVQKLWAEVAYGKD